MQNLKLYTYFRSSTAFRVRIAFQLKKLQYDAVFVNLLAHEQKSQEYEKINPNKSVPSLVLTDGTILIESMAICEYLDEVYPENKLLPSDPIKRAQVRGFCETINSGMHPYQNIRLLEWVENVAPGFDRQKFVTDALSRGYGALEILLQKSSGKYCFGDTITLADVFIFPQIYSSLKRNFVDIDKYPTVKKIYENLVNLPEFVAASPEQQPDFK